MPTAYGGSGPAAVGTSFERNLTGLYRFAALTSAPVQMYMQTRRYLSAIQAVPREYPVSITTVLRTRNVWVDRIRLRVAYQVKDSMGSVLVQRPSAVIMRVSLDGSTRISYCDTSFTQNAIQSYVAYCSTASLPLGWFGSHSSRTAVVTVALRNSANSADVASESSPLQIQPQPTWYDQTLRTSTIGNGLSAPVGLGLDQGGVFITLPVSPVYKQ